MRIWRRRWRRRRRGRGCRGSGFGGGRLCGFRSRFDGGYDDGRREAALHGKGSGDIWNRVRSRGIKDASWTARGIASLNPVHMTLETVIKFML